MARFGSDPEALARGTPEARKALAPELARATAVRRTLAKAILAVSERNIAAAADLIEDAWEMDPDDPDVAALAERIALRFWADSSRQHMMAHRYEEALSLCQRVLSIDPDNGRALAGCGVIYATRGQLDEAAALLERAVETEPDDPSILSGLAQVYVGDGRTDDAVAAYTRLGTLEGVDPMNVQRGLGFLVGCERYGRAIPLAEMHVRANQEDPDALAILGQCYAASGRLDEAIEAWEKASGFRPGDERLRQALSQAYRASGRTPPGR
jgi:Flp pilus assembly protein TadD